MPRTRLTEGAWQLQTADIPGPGQVAGRVAWQVWERRWKAGHAEMPVGGGKGRQGWTRNNGASFLGRAWKGSEGAEKECRFRISGSLPALCPLHGGRWSAQPCRKSGKQTIPTRCDKSQDWATERGALEGPRVGQGRLPRYRMLGLRRQEAPEFTGRGRCDRYPATVSCDGKRTRGVWGAAGCYTRLAHQRHVETRSWRPSSATSRTAHLTLKAAGRPWGEICPPKRDVGVLTPRTSEWALTGTGSL